MRITGRFRGPDRELMPNQDAQRPIWAAFGADVCHGRGMTPPAPVNQPHNAYAHVKCSAHGGTGDAAEG